MDGYRDRIVSIIDRYREIVSRMDRYRERQRAEWTDTG